MKFNKLALIKAIDKAVEADSLVIQRARAEAELKLADHRAEWLRINTEPWKEAVKKINAALRKGEVITENHVPRNRQGGPAFYRPTYAGAVPSSSVRELIGLRNVLAAVTDETISTTALRDLGVRAETMRKLVPLLGASTITSGTNQKGKA